MKSQPEGHFTIPARIYLTAEDRARLEYLVRSAELDLNELLSELLATYLSDKPLPESPPVPSQAGLEELRRRRDEARRLQSLRPGSDQTPGWFHSYLAQLEGEVARLERTLHGG